MATLLASLVRAAPGTLAVGADSGQWLAWLLSSPPTARRETFSRNEPSRAGPPQAAGDRPH